MILPLWDDSACCREPHPHVPRTLVRSLSVRRSDPVRWGTRLRRPRGSRGKTGLLSTIGPVAVGVLLAFAWNMAVSQQQEISGYVTPAVSSTVEQAAAQAWASSTPDAVTASAPHSARGGAWSPGTSRGPGAPARGGCSRLAPGGPRPVIVTGSPAPGHPTASVAPAGDRRNLRRAAPVRTLAACRSRPRFANATEMDSTVAVSAATAPTRTDAVTPARGEAQGSRTRNADG
jgi:hypothetical protein